MIPKRIITAWFGRGEKSDLFKRCQESWRLTNPAWEIVEVNEDTKELAPYRDMLYLHSVLKRGEWVKATELARLVGVYRFGGIYLDLDMEVIRPLDSLLIEGRSSFFVKQQDGLINGAMFGAEEGNATVGQLLAHFPLHTTGTNSALHYGPLFLSDALARIQDKSGMTTFPGQLCFPYFWNESDPGKYPEETLAIHRWAKSWAGGL